MEKNINYKFLTITGASLIILGFARYIDIIEQSTWEDPIQFIQALGFFIYGLGVYQKNKCGEQSKKAKKIIVLILFLAVSSFQAQAQSNNYSKQIEALQTSFENKNIEALQEYLSPSLKFGPIPAQNSPAILTNIVNNFPKLLELKVKSSKNGEAMVFYSFEGLGENESAISFDEEGRITNIAYLEEIVMREIQAQQRMQDSVQKPNPGVLADKYPAQSVEFTAKDGLSVSGDLYEIDDDSPVILLCHQANYNKFEYADIAPKLNEMGFNVLAIDQRSGGPFADHMNETATRAIEMSASEIAMIDAQQDIEAAVEFLSKKYAQKVTVWGSSYSASLSFFVANENPDVKAVIAFSPGNYFGDAKPDLSFIFEQLKVPFLITSSSEEATQITNLLSNFDAKTNQIQFIPESEGFHGSRALWEGQKGAEEYWEAITGFLGTVYSL